MNKNIKFIQNELGNIQILTLDNKELVGFIKHLELFKNDPEIIHLNISEEEFEKTKSVYAYIRHYRKTKIENMIEQLKVLFVNKNLYIESKTHKNKLIIMDLFLYE